MAKKVDKLSNFLPINRRFFSHPLWKEDRTFSKAEAWLWLIAEARFDAAVANELIGGKTVRWVRGELPASLRYLAEAWNWEKNQVDRFLKLLETEAMILRRLDKGQTIIRLINYSTHNGQNEMGHLNPHPASVSGESWDTGGKKEKSKIKMGQQTGHLDASLPTVSDDEWDSKRDRGGTRVGQGRDKTNIDNIENIEKKREPRFQRSFPLC